ncbi:serine hydrolase domain-containing protein [Arcticibacter eurypsychrophilus]|uniref:serine hydrolase domain-containing protein n=1 Tax=Arcticibacter eurypsychrophilus TaxID=1434752 RepID=UPI001480FF61|nr:serine hydrolase domain-containing protein [Arcticibacter eurypsychrophilus]
MKNYLSHLLILLLCLSLRGYASQESTHDLNASAIDSMLVQLEKAIEEAHMPGLMIAIANRDGILYSGGIGYSSLESRRKVNGKTSFRFASVTKMFTALAIEKLISEGRFRLDDTLKKIAPEIPFESPWEKDSPLRVVHLLEHTAGFEDVQLGRMIAPDNKSLHGLAALEFHKSSLRSRWKPGERMSYSNPGYEVLGYLIEKFSGMSVKNYIEKNILSPMGMKNSLITSDNHKIKNLSTAYHFNGNGYVVLSPYTLSSNGATGNLISCADDIAIYLNSLLNYHKGIDIPKTSIVDMDIIHSSLASKRGLQTGYALGNEIFPNNNRITFRGHNGLGEGFNSWIFYNRAHGIAYAIANNSGENNWRISQIIESFITRHVSIIPSKESQENLARFHSFTGYYAFANPKNDRWDFLKRIFNGVNLSLLGNKIILKNNSGGIDTLIYVEKNLFRHQSDIIPSFILSRDDNGVPFIQGYSNSLFFTKTGKAPILLQQYLFYLGFFSILVSLVCGIVGIVLLVLKKINLKRFSLLWMPAMATASGLLSYRKLVLTDEVNKVAFASVNTTTLFILFASVGFGVFTVVSLVQLIRQWNTLTNTFLKALLTFIIVMLCYLTGIFFINGWIGVCTWNL